MRACPKCATFCLQSHRFCPGCGADLSSLASNEAVDPLLHSTIAGQYLLKELIGTGGMGQVFRAEQKGVGRTVAIKIMHRHLLGDATAAARFINEARAASALNHPHSIAILDFGQTESGVLYIVMEYLRGQSLDYLLRYEFPLPLSRVALIMTQALDGVEAAHQQNIIHRDLKPENVFLLSRHAPRDFVKVLDFGIAKMLDLEERNVTTPGLVPGTPEYMSPEQARGEKLDPRSDVYSLGVILYELLTATVPFKGSSAIATMMSHVQDPVEPPSKRRPDLEIPAALEAIVSWALAKHTSDRIASAAQFRDVLTAWAQVAGVLPSEQVSASTPPDVLLDYFSEDQLLEMPSEVTSSQRVAVVEPIEGKPSALRGIKGERRVVGRQSELRQVERFLAQSGPRAMRIEAPAGYGKSMLIEEIVRRASSRGFPVRHCLPEPGWVTRPLGVARALLADCLDLPTADADDAAPAQEAMLAQAAAAFQLEAEDVEALRDLFGLPGVRYAEYQPQARRRERVAALRTVVERVAERDERLLIVFEDLERYDEPSRELAMALVTMPRGPVAV